MAESVPVRCPACRREHSFLPQTLPCPCGAPLTVPLLRGGVPVEVRHRSWNSSWVSMRCPSCGRTDEWPQPEFGCPCGATVRLPVDTSAQADRPPAEQSGPYLTAPALPGVRPPFRPVTIRTAADVVTAATRYLEWLGFTGVRPSENRLGSGPDIRGRGMIAKVDGSLVPSPARDVECLWLSSLNEETTGVCFALAGYSGDARLRADQLGIPLYGLDLTGIPQPVNEAADVLTRKGASAR